jgi:hypothetical protein
VSAVRVLATLVVGSAAVGLAVACWLFRAARADLAYAVRVRADAAELVDDVLAGRS